MKSLFKLAVILIGLAIFVFLEACSAKRGWILWYSDSLQGWGQADVKWKIESASPDFQRCSEAKKERFESLSKEVRALFELGTAKIHEDFIVALTEKQEEMTISFYNKQEPIKSLHRIFKLTCLPEGTDPKKLGKK